jgi:pantothenate kinase type III
LNEDGSHGVLLLEIGNTTIKLARPLGDDAFVLERFASADDALRRLASSGEPVIVAPVGERHSPRILERLNARGNVRVITREALARFVARSYDTPETLGLDRVLNVMGLTADAIVISCGTAITVDARVGGTPVWGAIMPGLATAAEGLNVRVPALPLVDVERPPRMPARTSLDSVANGVLLGAAHAARGLAAALARSTRRSLRHGAVDESSRDDAPLQATLPVILTGGDAQILERLWPAELDAHDELDRPIVDELVLFQGMLKAADG